MNSITVIIIIINYVERKIKPAFFSLLLSRPLIPGKK